MGLRKAAHWLPPAVVAAASLVLAAGGEAARQALRWERAGLADLELWRLVSGHLVHLGPAHLAFNLAGLGLVWILVGSAFGPGGWLLVAAASVAAIDAGFWILDPGLSWYVGLSGLLHGLLAAGVIREAQARPAEAAVLGVLVGAKLAWETVAGPLPGSEQVSGGSVITAAHLYGACGGAVAGASLAVVAGRRRPAAG